MPRNTENESMGSTEFFDAHQQRLTKIDGDPGSVFSVGDSDVAIETAYRKATQVSVEALVRSEIRQPIALFNQTVLEYTVEQEEEALGKLDQAINNTKQLMNSHYAKRLAMLDRIQESSVLNKESRDNLNKQKQKIQNDQQKTQRDFNAYTTKLRTNATEALNKRGARVTEYWKAMANVKLAHGGMLERPEPRSLHFNIEEHAFDIDANGQELNFQGGEFTRANIVYRNTSRDSYVGKLVSFLDTLNDKIVSLIEEQPGHNAVTFNISGNHASFSAPWVCDAMWCALSKTFDIDHPYYLQAAQLSRAADCKKVILLPGSKCSEPIIAARMAIKAGLDVDYDLNDKVLADVVSKAKAERDAAQQEAGGAAQALKAYQAVSPEVAELNDYLDVLLNGLVPGNPLYGEVDSPRSSSISSSSSSSSSSYSVSSESSMISDEQKLPVKLVEEFNGLVDKISEPGLPVHHLRKLPIDSTHQNLLGEMTALHGYLQTNQHTLSGSQHAELVKQLRAVTRSVDASWNGFPIDVKDGEKEAFFKQMLPHQQIAHLQVLHDNTHKDGATQADKQIYQQRLKAVCQGSGDGGTFKDENECYKFIRLLQDKEFNPAEKNINDELLQALFENNHANWDLVMTEFINERMLSGAYISTFNSVIKSPEQFDALIEKTDRMMAKSDLKEDLASRKGALHRDSFTPERFNQLPAQVQQHRFFAEKLDIKSLKSLLNDNHAKLEGSSDDVKFRHDYTPQAKANLLIGRVGDDPVTQLIGLSHLGPLENPDKFKQILEHLPDETQTVYERYLNLLGADKLSLKDFSASMNGLTSKQHMDVSRLALRQPPLPGGLFRTEVNFKEKQEQLAGAIAKYVTTPAANQGENVRASDRTQPPSRFARFFKVASPAASRTTGIPLHWEVIWDVLASPNFEVSGESSSSTSGKMNQQLDICQRILNECESDLSPEEQKLSNIIESSDITACKNTWCAAMVDCMLQYEGASDTQKIKHITDIVSKETNSSSPSKIGQSIQGILKSDDDVSTKLNTCQEVVNSILSSESSSSLSSSH